MTIERMHVEGVRECREQSRRWLRQFESDMYARVKLGIVDPDECVLTLKKARAHLRRHRRQHLRVAAIDQLQTFAHRAGMVLAGAGVVAFLIALAWISVSAAAFGFAPGVLGRP